MLAGSPVVRTTSDIVPMTTHDVGMYIVGVIPSARLR